MRVAKHIVEARRSRLTELLLERGYVPISELCEELDVSEATARRDLSALESEERITRTYGGALGEFNATFTSFRERLREGTEAKCLIARAAVSLIKPGMGVYLDAGTTAFAIAQELRRHLPERLTLITNNLALLETLGSLPGAKTILLGGQLLERQPALHPQELEIQRHVSVVSMRSILASAQRAPGLSSRAAPGRHASAGTSSRRWR